MLAESTVALCCCSELNVSGMWAARHCAIRSNAVLGSTVDLSSLSSLLLGAAFIRA